MRFVGEKAVEMHDDMRGLHDDMGDITPPTLTTSPPHHPASVAQTASDHRNRLRGLKDSQRHVQIILARYLLASDACISGGSISPVV
jgi:hypothetical protein